MIDPLTSLAFSIYSNKGVYALLIGSGISRAAEIPTGWEITLDLIRKLAAIEGEKCGLSPELWYAKKYGGEADYSDLLEKVAITPSERVNILAKYFEPTSEDLQLGRKSPTQAHKAIARLSAMGYFKVILTTNFDRLMEQALAAEGINPTVISTVDMVRGAMPLVHAQCTLIKLHGDYRDTRIKNTSEELTNYSGEMNLLLDRIFDEYGLLVCGWSATWDHALSGAMLRSPNRRFTCFWTSIDRPAAKAAELIHFRHATLLEIKSADTVFMELEQKIESLDSFLSPHPLAIPVAVASLKRYLVEERFRIELFELVNDEVEKQIKNLSPLATQFKHQDSDQMQQEYLKRVGIYDDNLEMLIALISHGCFHGNGLQAPIWRDAIVSMTRLSRVLSGDTLLLNLMRYPSSLLLYAGGIAAASAKKYVALKSLLRDSKAPRLNIFESQGEDLIFHVTPGQVIDGNSLGAENLRLSFTPASDHIFNVLREPLRKLIPSDDEYAEYFDRFEYFFTLTYFDKRWTQKGVVPHWAPVGRFAWRRSLGSRANISELITKESKEEIDNWGPIRDGLFSSFKRFTEVNDTYRDSILSRIPW